MLLPSPPTAPLLCTAPPFRPLQNFEQYDDDRPPASMLGPSGSGRSRPIADPNFIGYTYKNWDAVHATQGARDARVWATGVGWLRAGLCCCAEESVPHCSGCQF